MKIGIGLPNQVRNVNPRVLPGWAAQAEQAGFSTLGTLGRIAYPGVMDTVALAAAAGATSTIGLFTGLLVAPVWPGALLAKEIAGIDGISGGRLTLGLGVGAREDDFVAEAHGPRARGKRFDQDLQTYHDVWSGENVGGDLNPAVPQGTRKIPLMFGGMSPAALQRMARWGEGFIGGTLPAPLAEPSFDAARAAWQAEGRTGSPRLVGQAYFALGDTELCRSNLRYFYSVIPHFVDTLVDGVADSATKVREYVEEYEDRGADELIFHAGTDDPAEVARLAEIVF